MKISTIKKFFRYLITGYLFERKEIYRKLSEFQSESWDGLECKNSEKIVVYTVIYGGYDEPCPPAFISEDVDYIIFTDRQIADDCGWKKIDVELPDFWSELSVQEKSRYFKMFPDRVFGAYDYSVYVDGNVIINGDIKPIIYKMQAENKSICMHKHSVRECIYDEGRVIYALGKVKMMDVVRQLHRYKKEGMPSQFGLFENNIIARKHHDEQCKKIMNIWWHEYRNGCKRDQLSFMYAIWKCGLTKDFILSMGSNSRNNPMFQIKGHRQ